MKKFPLSIFSKLTNKYEPSSENELDELILQSTSEQLASKEYMYFSKPDQKTFLPNDKQNLRNLRIPIGKEKGKKKKNTINKQSTIIGSDLTIGFLDYRRPTEEEIYLLLDLLLALDKIEKRDSITIASLRRNLLLLMLIPLNPSKEFLLNIIRWENYLIIDKDWTTDSLISQINNLNLENSDTDLLSYTGFRFEDLVTENEEEDSQGNFYTVTGHDISGTSVVFTAEIDASVKGKDGLSGYVELKSHRYSKNSTIDLKLSRKLLSSWCQTRLISGKYVVIGFRKKSETYNLAAIKTYDTNDIPNLLHSKGQPVYVSMDDKDSQITCQKLLKWYQCVMAWIIQEIGSSQTSHTLMYDPESRELKLTPSTENIRPSWMNTTN